MALFPGLNSVLGKKRAGSSICCCLLDHPTKQPHAVSTPSLPCLPFPQTVNQNKPFNCFVQIFCLSSINNQYTNQLIKTKPPPAETPFPQTEDQERYTGGLGDVINRKHGVTKCLLSLYLFKDDHSITGCNTGIHGKPDD